MIRVAALTPAMGPAWAALFDASASPCFCRYWHFAGGKNEWLARCAGDADANRREQLASLEAGEPASRGLVALDGDSAVGWMKLAPKDTLPKLTRLPVYRGAEAVPGAYGVGCLLVHPAHRRRGVARALVAAADAHVRGWGGRAIEAYPRRAHAPLHDEEAWMGPERLYIEAGYAVVFGDAPYPTYRKMLGPERNETAT